MPKIFFGLDVGAGLLHSVSLSKLSLSQD